MLIAAEMASEKYYKVMKEKEIHYGMSCSFMDGNCVLLDDGKVYGIVADSKMELEPINKDSINPEILELLRFAYSNYYKRKNLLENIEANKQQIKVFEENFEKHKAELTNQINIMEIERKCLLQDIQKEVKKKKLKLVKTILEEQLTGDEVLEMKLNPDKVKASIIINKTSRPIFYTHGFSMRNPTTNHKPVTKEEAIEILNQNHWTDIFFKEDEIHINTYSDCDMF